MLTKGKQYVTISKQLIRMVNCDYCGKEINRHIFCSASCKVRFHRGDKIKTTIPQAVNTKEEVEESIGFSQKKKLGFHFNALLNGYVKD